MKDFEGVFKEAMERPRWSVDYLYNNVLWMSLAHADRVDTRIIHSVVQWQIGYD